MSIRDAAIVAIYAPPPIPLRDKDWHAYREGYKERGEYGYGKTRDEAIDALLRLESELYLDNGEYT